MNFKRMEDDMDWRENQPSETAVSTKQRVLENEINQLATSERGRDALSRLLDWLDHGGLGLDDDNRSAVVSILCAAWTNFPQTARDLIRAALKVQLCDPGDPIRQAIAEKAAAGETR